jgi:hypothetical protein
MAKDRCRRWQSWYLSMQDPFLFSGDFKESYFFSITHCKGCWCLRAKSITCVTLVSAIS